MGNGNFPISTGSPRSLPCSALPTWELLFLRDWSSWNIQFYATRCKFPHGKMVGEKWEHISREFLNICCSDVSNLFTSPILEVDFEIQFVRTSYLCRDRTKTSRWKHHSFERRPHVLAFNDVAVLSGWFQFTMPLTMVFQNPTLLCIWLSTACYYCEVAAVVLWTKCCG